MLRGGETKRHPFRYDGCRVGAQDGGRKGSVLDPVERLSEILFGLIMAMTFTGSIHAANVGEPEEVRAVLVGAIGCNIAWGIVDAVMYVMTTLVARSRALRALHALRGARTRDEAVHVLTDALPESVARRMSASDFESLHAWILGLPRERVRMLTARDLRGALGVFLLVSISTFPVVVPFLVVSDSLLALRLSHGVALAMLFLIGWTFGKYAGMSALKMGISMLGIGVVLAGVAIALGG